ncbi:MAG TPA: Smr/MutS family protein [Steroidobacteraceae bacterium]|nr:Smr/MutS family protein [Steroidobacteraceae bacterium]
MAGKDDERDLFRAAMRGVRPLSTPERASPARRKPPPRARQTRAERAAVLSESLAPPDTDLDIQPGDSMQYRQAGVPETVLRRLRRGDYRIEAEIDLHGLRLAEARVQLRQFLLAALARRLQCLRIVHGKGLRSGQRGPVIKNAVHSLLRRAAPVLAFTSAAMRDGGTGATLVLLRANPRP